MQILTVFITLALLAIRACSASAPMPAINPRKVPYVTMFLQGDVQVGPIATYPNYTLSVPEDGSTMVISESLASSDILIVSVEAEIVRCN